MLYARLAQKTRRAGNIYLMCLTLRDLFLILLVPLGTSPLDFSLFTISVPARFRQIPHCTALQPRQIRLKQET